MIKKISLRSIVIFSFAAFSGGLLFYTSQNVQRAEDDLRAAQSTIVKEQEVIRVLEAEWAFLNSPARLEALAIEYLDIVPPSAGQVMQGGASLPTLVLPDSAAGGLRDVSFSAPSAEVVPASGVFVRPRKKPRRSVVRKKMVVKKRFDTLLDELENGGAQ